MNRGTAMLGAGVVLLLVASKSSRARAKTLSDEAILVERPTQTPAGAGLPVGPRPSSGPSTPPSIKPKPGAGGAASESPSSSAVQRALEAEAAARAARVARMLEEQRQRGGGGGGTSSIAPKPAPAPVRPAPTPVRPAPTPAPTMDPSRKDQATWATESPPPGFDRVKASNAAGDVAAHLRKRGRDGYSRDVLRAWQRVAGIPADGIYGRQSEAALRYYVGVSAPKAFFAQGEPIYVWGDRTL